MRIKQFCFNPIGENTYLLWDENTLDAAIVDCGAQSTEERQSLDEEIRSDRLILRMAIQTHGHFDHIFGLPHIYKKYGLHPMMHRDDAELYISMPEFTRRFGLIMNEPLPIVEHYLNHNETLTLGTQEIHVIHTPGHTKGGVCFYVPSEDMLISGDTIFREGVGRTDLPGGSYSEEIESIRERLFTLPEQTIVYPGHGPSTSIAWEKTHNPCAY